MKRILNVTAPCKVCQKNRAKRSCPALEAGICPACCGVQREVTIDCPLDCFYLREARRHEKPAELTEADIPNRDLQITEDFLRQQEPLLTWVANALTRAMENGKAVDADARESIEALIRTYRTLESGLIYETRTPNPYAAGIQEALKTAIEDFRKLVAEKTGMQSLRDKDLLGTLVFLQRLELQYANGRRRGRAFFDFLRAHFPAEAQPTLVP